MEDQILTYKYCDIVDSGLYNFTDCKLKVDFGPFKVGQHFDWVNISIDEALIEFCETDQGESVRVPFKIIAV